MSTSSRGLLLVAATLTAAVALSGCAVGPRATLPPTSTTVPSDQRLEDAHAAPPEGRVIGTGTVIDGASGPALCLGAIMESYPPQCSGVPLNDWTWDGVDGSESAGDTRWGSYAVYGTFDGERLTVTDPPILLALFDPVAPEDPTGGKTGSTPEGELTRVQDDIAARLGPAAVFVGTDGGYVWLQVAWDDGTLQRAADAEYGDGVVIVESLLREVD
ncbi:hypothetical protein [Microbacterium paraoxydans]|uniref:hypothetical protein n=1 Tax=Microbacterium paraoxydans TaxID=199592 RepID=UPI003D7048C0